MNKNIVSLALALFLLTAVPARSSHDVSEPPARSARSAAGPCDRLDGEAAARISAAQQRTDSSLLLATTNFVVRHAPALPQAVVDEIAVQGGQAKPRMELAANLSAGGGLALMLVGVGVAADAMSLRPDRNRMWVVGSSMVVASSLALSAPFVDHNLPTTERRNKAAASLRHNISEIATSYGEHFRWPAATVEKFGTELSSRVWTALDEAQRSAKESKENNGDFFRRASNAIQAIDTLDVAIKVDPDNAPTFRLLSEMKKALPPPVAISPAERVTGLRESQVRLRRLEQALSTEAARKECEVVRKMFAAAEVQLIDLCRLHAH